MTVTSIAFDRFLDELRSPLGPESLASAAASAVVVDLAGELPPVPSGLAAAIESVPAVLVGVRGDDGQLDPAVLDLFDVVAAAGGPMLEAAIAAVRDRPLASTTLAMLLRSSERRSIGEGLVGESAAYSALQAGPEFASWRAGRPHRARPAETSPSVTATRVGDRLDIVLSRPAVRNALDAHMRDGLLDALAVAIADDTITTVTLRGDGPSFCSGGDLEEFGSRPDPATAHIVRLERSIGRAIATLADRIVVSVHGPCCGSGIELPAFASRVIARRDTTLSLPEIGLGLIPGAGGTVSITRRIGRHRTALLALSQQPIDAQTALQWGLVDEITE